jgi:hypothetical protein
VVHQQVEFSDNGRESGGFLEEEGINANVHAIKGDGFWLRAVWTPWKGTSIETWLLPSHEDTPLWHIPIHHIKDVVRIGGERVRVSDAGFVVYAQSVDGRSFAFVEDDDARGARLLHCYGKLEGLETSVGSGVIFSLIRSAAGLSREINLTSLVFPGSKNTSPRCQHPSRTHPIIHLCPQVHKEVLGSELGGDRSSIST